MKTIAVLWNTGHPEGAITITAGTLAGLRLTEGIGTVQSHTFAVQTPCRLEIDIDDAQLSAAAGAPTMVTFVLATHPFTLLLRDVSQQYPIWIPAYNVLVTDGTDTRCYHDVVAQIGQHGGRTQLQAIAIAPEASFARAAAVVREEHVPTWLGISRDIRIFELHGGHDTWSFSIMPRRHGMTMTIPEGAEGQQLWYTLLYGKGIGPVREISRRLEDGVLPILRSRLLDDDVVYHTTAFVSLEQSPLTPDTVRGSHFLAADGHGEGHMFTPEQQARYDTLEAGEVTREEETVLYYRIEAVNQGVVPRYAWFQLPRLAPAVPFTCVDGCAAFTSGGRVFVTARLNGEPLRKDEVAVLVAPGETATFEFALPHGPISPERGRALLAQSFAVRHAECRAFWQAKLATAAQLSLPEPRIEEMVRAGLLHLDLVAYGQEPDGPVAASIGVYCPIGSESAPIIQFFDVMGWPALAERALGYFLEKQHPDGFMQNFGGYMLETGPALWSMGEHFRYTRDLAWVKRIEAKLLLAVDCLCRWRARNMTESLRGHGYGLLDGKVADPEDPFHGFMLNGYAYLGLTRVAEMLAAINPDAAARAAREAAALKRDLRQAVAENLAVSPVVPLGDGSWSPTLAPWAEGRGPVSLLTDGEHWSTHGAFVLRDSLIGPLYLIFTEVLDPEEALSSSLLAYHTELFHSHNVAPSQPYYSPHPWAHARRGEVKAFLQEYYTAMAGLADRETYSFWEHFYHLSPHKTHEEAWFLMRTRWMLYLEVGETLRLLPMIPRAWLSQGQWLQLTNVQCYFGPFSLTVDAQPHAGFITAHISCTTARRPSRVTIRLPHPDGLRAVSVSGGSYAADTETVVIAEFTGEAAITLWFAQSNHVTVK